MNSCCSCSSMPARPLHPWPMDTQVCCLQNSKWVCTQPITSPQNSLCTSNCCNTKQAPYAIRPSTDNTNWENDAWWAIAAWEYSHSLLLQAQHSSTAWTVGMRLGVSVNNIKQCLSLWLSYIPHTNVCHEGLDFPCNITSLTTGSLVNLLMSLHCIIQVRLALKSSLHPQI